MHDNKLQDNIGQETFANAIVICQELVDLLGENLISAYLSGSSALSIINLTEINYIAKYSIEDGILRFTRSPVSSTKQLVDTPFEKRYMSDIDIDFVVESSQNVEAIIFDFFQTKTKDKSEQVAVLVDGSVYTQESVDFYLEGKAPNIMHSKFALTPLKPLKNEDWVNFMRKHSKQFIDGPDNPTKLLKEGYVNFKTLWRAAYFNNLQIPLSALTEPVSYFIEQYAFSGQTYAKPPHILLPDSGSFKFKQMVI